MQKKLLITTSILLLSLSFCKKDDSKQEIVNPSSAKISLEKSWVRLVPPGQKTTGAYVTIKNTGNGDDVLLSASSDVANVTELHEMIMEKEVMKMKKIESIPVPSGKTVELKPGDLHIMLIDLKRDLKDSEEIIITLNFQKMGKVELPAKVKKSEDSMKDHGHKH